MTEFVIACRISQHRRAVGSAGKSEVVLRCNCTAWTLAFVGAVPSILLKLSTSWTDLNVGSILLSLYDLHAQWLVAVLSSPTSLPMVPLFYLILQGRAPVSRSDGWWGSALTSLPSLDLTALLHRTLRCGGEASEECSVATSLSRPARQRFLSAASLPSFGAAG